MRKLIQLIVVGATAAAAVLLMSRPVLAHGIGGRVDLPVPLELLIVGAGLVVVVSFVLLALLWPEPRFQEGPLCRPTGGVGFPGWLSWLLGAVGVLSLALVVGQVVPEWLGVERDLTRPTIAPVLVWVGFWLIVPFGSALVGNWYADLSPWRVLGLPLQQPERSPVSRRFGLWPATVIFMAFTWLELISPGSGDPATLGYAALAYTLFLLGAMWYAGRETGLFVFDPFTSYNRLVSAISPLGRDSRGRIYWRGWLRSLPVLPEWRGLWIFVVAIIGTISYDGASGTEWFRDLTGGAGDTMLGETLLLICSVVAVGLAYLAASAVAARSSPADSSPLLVAQRFAHTLVPIALAYAFAHYFTLVLFEGQQLIAAVSDPFGLGWDLFGTADRRVAFFITDTDPVWYIQVASIVLGHVLGVVLAHDRALHDFGRDAVRSQYAMLVLMVALTTLGLLILAG